ncbi:YoaK family protein [Agarivorans aestuarii]|uniref:YoaK family protein n=1 Tax=Agarivorans aestuarii TaxID=1563703 RepID=A0ABU7G5M8_9ALTE|nr:YoaK family protein [Agarivorans aestuarii]MEE1674713.1 YoaK family protein [Agarivorans aestuarii]
MISKLPRWVEYGSFVLAFIAGLVNAIGLLGFKHQAVSHLSGTATLIGTGIIDSNPFALLHLTLVVFSFLLGSTISGFFLPSESLKLGRNYSGLLLLEACFLVGSALLLSQDFIQGHYLASAACGLQNALATTFSGAVVRTTHLTGIVTDLGIMFGAKVRGEPFDKRKATLFFIIILGFIAGGAFGALFFNGLKFNALFIPAGICLLLAVSYSIYNAQMSQQ